MAGFTHLLRTNRNYRYTWIGQIVSEIGDHFNTVAVFTLALESTGSGLVVSGLMMVRALPILLAGPVAGVLLDRLDRKQLMILSDVVRAVIGIAFLLALEPGRTWLLFVLSFLLMFASPFFTSGRAAILPTITTKDELHTANSLTKTTQWLATTIGAMLGGVIAQLFGYGWTFVFNAASFVFSAACIWRLRAPKGFRAERKAVIGTKVIQPWHEYADGLRYMRSVPLLFAIGLVHIGWAAGGGAAQILFTLFGEIVYPFGAAGLGTIWGFAGVGLLIGGTTANWIGNKPGFDGYKKLILASYLVYGGAYIFFSQVRPFWMVLVFIAMSRAGMGLAGVLNTTLLLRHVSDVYRGRVFATIESITWGTMLLSMALTGLATEYWDPRTIGTAAGIAGLSAAVIWLVADWGGRLKEPAAVGVEPDEVEVREEPAI